VTETWSPSTDGVVTRLKATVHQLLRAGHQVLVVAPGATGLDVNLDRMAGLTVRTVPSAGLRFLYGGQRWGLPLPRVGRYLRDFSPDVVHVLNPACLGIAGVLAARWQRRPLVCSYHTDLTQHAPHYHIGWLVPVIWALLRALHGASTLNLATSQTAIAKLDAQGIPAARLWPRGVDTELFQPEPRPPRVGQRPVALYVGRLAGEKGLERLAPLADPDSGIDLVLVGEGPQRLQLERLFRPGTARFTGTLQGAALAAAYRSADVFVFPSTTETLGLVLLEALASGLSVVAADSPASRELLADCDRARLFPSTHPAHIVALVHQLGGAPTDALERAQIREQALRWGWPAATAQLLTFYGDAVAMNHDSET